MFLFNVCHITHYSWAPSGSMQGNEGGCLSGLLLWPQYLAGLMPDTWMFSKNVLNEQTFLGLGLNWTINVYWAKSDLSVLPKYLGLICNCWSLDYEHN